MGFWRVAVSGGTNATPSNRSCSSSATAVAARLADPPSPGSGTSDFGLAGRPGDLVGSYGPRARLPTGSRLARRGGAADAGERVPNRSLSSAARSSRASRPSSAGVLNVWYEASVRTRQQLVRRGCGRRGVLTESSRGKPSVPDSGTPLPAPRPRCRTGQEVRCQ